eukprot:248612-Amphidinium_carterae.1
MYEGRLQHCNQQSELSMRFTDLYCSGSVECIYTRGFPPVAYFYLAVHWHSPPTSKLVIDA